MENTIYNYQGRDVRTIPDGETIWFVAKDICDVLEVGNPSQAISRLDEDEKNTITLNEGNKGNPNLAVVNESGLYSLILSSRKPEAKQFKRWITHEVLPSIRKHGAYMTESVIEQTLSNPDFIIQLATQLKEEKAKRLEVENEKSILQSKIEENEPLVIFAETALKSNDNILVRELSKIAHDEKLNIGEKKLYEKLRSWGFILKSSREPSQYGMKQGYFVVDEAPYKTPYGIGLNRTTKVTPKGQIYIIEKLKKERNKKSE